MSVLRLRLALDDEALGRLVAGQAITFSMPLPRTGYARGHDRVEIDVEGAGEAAVGSPQLTIKGDANG